MKNTTGKKTHDVMYFKSFHIQKRMSASLRFCIKEIDDVKAVLARLTFTTEQLFWLPG